MTPTDIGELDRKNKELTEINLKLKKAKELADINAKLELENKLLTNVSDQAQGSESTPTKKSPLGFTSKQAELYLTIGGVLVLGMGLVSPVGGGLLITVGVVCIGLVYLRRQGKL